MPVGKPSIATPNRAPGDANSLRPWQQAINNIRERFVAVEAAVTALGAASTSAVSPASITALRNSLTLLQRRVSVLEQEVAAIEAEEGGIYMPVVTGEIPPVLVYLADGNLVYTRVD